MKVEDVMAREIIGCDPSDSVAVAAQKMRDRNVGCVVVANNGSVQGIITDRDIAIRSTAQGRDPQNEVSSCMTTPVATISPEADILDAAHLMADRGVRRIPVERDGHLVGLLSFSDLAWALDRPMHDLLFAGAAAARHPA